MYLERKLEGGKYIYRHSCPICGVDRWTSRTKAGRCASCAGKASYVKPTKPRSNSRKRGDGYITKQGYHLVYNDGAYVPAHRLVVGELKDDEIVHHIDGNKLNNSRDNLYICTRDAHRAIHGQLERISYFLIQNGMIEFEDGRYRLSTPMKQFVGENSVNSGKPLTVDAEGNPEPSPVWGRCNDYPEQGVGPSGPKSGEPK